MKKSILALCCALTFMVGTNYSNAQALQQGDSHVDVYAGFPNILNTYLRVNWQLIDQDEQVQLKTVPTIGLKCGYMIADNLSLGLDFNYSSFNFSYTDNATNYDYNIGINRYRAMARFEIHFSSSDQLDMYVPIAAGIHLITPNISTTDPDEQDLVDEVGSSINAVVGILGFPFAARAGFGIRYFFTDNLGVNLEIGLGGGSLIQGGVALKF